MADTVSVNKDGGHLEHQNSDGVSFGEQVFTGAPADAVILASGARTTTQTSADLQNDGGRGIKVVLDMTVVGTGSVTLTIKGKDPASGKYYTLLAGAAVVTNVTNTYTVYPGLTAVTNVTASDVLPKVFQILVTANNANTATYSVGATILA